MRGSINAVRLAARQKNPAPPPTPIATDETLLMNNSSLPPELGDRSEQPAEMGQAAEAANGDQAARVDAAAPPARPTSGNEATHAGGTTAPRAEAPAGTKPRRRLWPLALTGLAVALLIAGIVPRLT